MNSTIEELIADSQPLPHTTSITGDSFGHEIDKILLNTCQHEGSCDLIPSHKSFPLSYEAIQKWFVPSPLELMVFGFRYVPAQPMVITPIEETGISPSIISVSTQISKSRSTVQRDLR